MLHSTSFTDEKPPSSSTSTTNEQPSSSPQKHIFAPGTSSTTNPSTTNPSTTTTTTTPTPPSRAAQFHKATLTPSSLHPSPTTLFTTWFTAAQTASIPAPETCTLATAHLPSGLVSARTVYLKELDARGWVIYSNWGTSQKAADIKSNPHASLVFWWPALERQVRVSGATEFLRPAESHVYFETRARGSRIGAHASLQSEVLRGGREELEERVRRFEETFKETEEIPLPEYWGGLRVVAREVEFWQGRENRLHDRFRYTRVGEGEEGGNEEGWRVERLSP